LGQPDNQDPKIALDAGKEHTLEVLAYSRQKVPKLGKKLPAITPRTHTCRPMKIMVTTEFGKPLPCHAATMGLTMVDEIIYRLNPSTANYTRILAEIET